MSVWAVNSALTLPGAERHYPSLQAAAPHILQFASRRSA